MFNASKTNSADQTYIYLNVQLVKKKKTLIYFNANCHTEMKLVPINMDYNLLQFDALKFVLGVRLKWGASSLKNILTAALTFLPLCNIIYNIIPLKLRFKV